MVDTCSISNYVITCTDVKDGFDQVPASPVRVVAGDNVSVECLANWYTYNASSLHWVTAGSNMSITSRARLTVARSRLVASLRPVYPRRLHTNWLDTQSW